MHCEAAYVSLAQTPTITLHPMLIAVLAAAPQGEAAEDRGPTRPFVSQGPAKTVLRGGVRALVVAVSLSPSVQYVSALGLLSSTKTWGGEVLGSPLGCGISGPLEGVGRAYSPHCHGASGYLGRSPYFGVLSPPVAYVFSNKTYYGLLRTTPDKPLFHTAFPLQCALLLRLGTT
ncbi:uncharacterized protein EI90DRAFT_87025 [Cantharellus anzutake]|uniref:uncharacterized protein n=1 Tax=Cantharellus anzutake TaxID=1750568 RepID=UPI0019086193|nr:uncharacterized protein EI90DRAFT_87025 [Cantharellus anzutake]KAF8336917.1 hypothetical protein EI90DRAFT_87025 [Cantharellus anzutake]